MPTPTSIPRGHEPTPLRYAGGSMTTTDTDLRGLSDDQLDVMLSNEYRDHQVAKQAGDAVEAGACHLAIRAILDEQSRRLDVWISEHVSA